MERFVQFSIFLVNKPGVLTQIFRELAKAKVNIRRRDRKRLGPPTEESSMIEPVLKRSKAMCLK